MSETQEPARTTNLFYSPRAAAIVAGYTRGQIIQFSDGQHFIIGHIGATALVLVPIDASEAERVCGSDAQTTLVSSMN